MLQMLKEAGADVLPLLHAYVLKKLTPLLVKVGLTVSVVKPALDMVDTVEELEEAAADIEAFLLRMLERVGEQAVPLIHSFLFSKYDLFASSKLTFRDMKEHLSSELGMPYERLKADELSNVIEDAVDNVTNECRAGKTPRDECAAKIGYVLPV